jgi:post-segregation antitoxin (ccd killing protein)
MESMSKGAAKLSVSVPDDLAKAVRKRVGARGLSGFVATAMRHELERAQLGSYLAEMDDALGPVPAKTLALARTAWLAR